VSRLRWVVGLAVVGSAFVLAGWTGATPPRAPSRGARDPGGYTVVTNGPLAVPNGALVHATTSCPAGTVVWGGGTYNSASTSLAAAVNGTYPLASKRGWQVDVTNASGGDSTFYAYAICAAQPSGYKIVKATFPDPAGLGTGGLAACSSSSVPLSGGGDSSSTQLDVNLNSTYPFSSASSSGWVTDVSNPSADDATLTVYAICAKKPGPSGYEIVAGPIGTNAAGQQSYAYADCSGANVAVGGGVWSSSRDTAVIASTSDPYPTDQHWAGYENNGSSIDQKFRAYAVCVS
jgi:hypothetical protein